MLKRIVSFAFVVLALAATLNGQSYKSMWKTTESFVAKDLPSSAIGELDKIIAKAQSEHNDPQMVRAIMARTTLRRDIAPDSFRVDTAHLRRWALTTGDKVARAAAFAVISSCSRVKGDIVQALRDKEVLAQTTTKQYLPLVESIGADSRYFGDDMLSLIALYIDRTNVYDEVADYYEKSGRRTASLMMRLEASPGRDKLLKMAKEYADIDACGHVYERLIDYAKDNVEKLEFARKGMALYPKCRAVNALKEAESEVLEKSCKMVMPQTMYPLQTAHIEVRSKNVNEATLMVYKMSQAGLNDRQLERKNKEKWLKKYGKLISKTSYPLTMSADYTEATQKIAIGVPEVGRYVYQLSAKGCKEAGYCEVGVTRLTYYSISQPGGKTQYRIVDAMTGFPVMGAKMKIDNKNSRSYNDDYDWSRGNSLGLASQQEPNGKYEIEANPRGFLTLTSGVMRAMYPVAGADSFAIASAEYGRKYEYTKPTIKTVERVFTDRSIYRPGQSVHVAALVTREGGDSVSVQKNAKVTFELLNASREKIGTVVAETNALGVASADFTLPTKGLTGSFLVRANNHSQTISVEEYKRPTFKMEFDKVSREYGVGDTVTVRGRCVSMAGVPLEGISVVYELKKYKSQWWWQKEDTRLRQDTVVTGSDGVFDVEIVIDSVANSDAREYRSFFYYIDANAVNGQGEKQEASFTLPYGPTRVDIGLTLPDVLLKESPQGVSIVVKSASGEMLRGEAEYKLYKARKEMGRWVDDGLVQTGKIDNGAKELPREIMVKRTGNYRLHVTWPGDTVSEAVEKFALVSMKDNKCPESEPFIFFSAHPYIDKDMPVALCVGSDTVANAVIEIFSGNKRVYDRFFELDGTINQMALPMVSVTDKSVTAVCVMQSNGKCYRQEIHLAYRLPKKNLDYSWTSFRDKLVPGQKEKWTLKLSKNGRPADANVIATMYDASLDQLRGSNFDFSFYMGRSFPRVNTDNRIIGAAGDRLAFFRKKYWYDGLHYSKLYGFDSPVMGGEGIKMHFTAPLLKKNSETATFFIMDVKGNDDSSGEDVKEVRVRGAAKLYDVVETTATIPSSDVSPDFDQSSAEASKAAMSVRKNFNETAFFYPQLRTDASGEVGMEFTLPESLTSWNFKALAHTAEMDNCMIEETIEAQKDFMIQANLPRFMRVGDKTSVGYTVMNLADKAVNGKVRLELFDIETEKVVAAYNGTFATEKGRQQSGSFEFNVGNYEGAIGVRFMAYGNGFSDGEQHLVAVLPNKEMVLETLPLTVVGKGRTTFDLTKLFAGNAKSATGRRMTVEFTSNPVWLAVQALPSMTKSDNRDVVSLAAAYYANEIASHIVKTNPKIGEMMKVWKEKGVETESPLMKNEELRNLLLAETPWMLDARSEKRQREAIYELLDEGEIKTRQRDIVTSLGKLQTADGSFTWYQGMPGSPFLTRCVEEMFVRIDELTGNLHASSMQEKALKYLDKVAEEEYEAIKKNKDKSIPSEFACHYAYICALSSKTNAKRTEMAKKYLSLIEKHPKELSIYGKAVSAVALAKYGRKEKTSEFAQSVLEYSVANKQLGRYFDTPRAEMKSVDFRMPTQVAAVEALMKLMPEKKDEVLQMKQWIVQAKRTQSWENAFSSVNAIHALLEGTGGLLDAGKQARISVNGEVVCSDKTADDGLGYVKSAVETKPILAAPKKLVVESENDFVGFGGVYAQFEQPLKEMKNADGGMQIVLKWQKVCRVDGKEVAEDLFDKNGKQQKELHIGDKVRAVVTFVNRQDMEYVQVSLSRPACAEPKDVLSGYRWTRSVAYYGVTKDASSRFFIDRLAKGEHSVSADFVIDRKGVYETGMANIQCAYSTEFSAHTRSFTFNVK